MSDHHGFPTQKSPDSNDNRIHPWNPFIKFQQQFNSYTMCQSLALGKLWNGKFETEASSSSLSKLMGKIFLTGLIANSSTGSQMIKGVVSNNHILHSLQQCHNRLLSSLFVLPHFSFLGWLPFPAGHSLPRRALLMQPTLWQSGQAPASFANFQHNPQSNNYLGTNEKSKNLNHHVPQLQSNLLCIKNLFHFTEYFALARYWTEGLSSLITHRLT